MDYESTALTMHELTALKLGARNRNRTGTPVKARDFKSLVSTYFTTRAVHLLYGQASSLSISS